MRRISAFSAIVVFAMVLSSCAAWAPGKDPRGKTYIEQAAAVCQAAAKYLEEKGSMPLNLSMLVPSYITRLPTRPELRLAPAKDKDGIVFSYSPNLAIGQCICHAVVSECHFNCGPCYL